MCIADPTVRLQKHHVYSWRWHRWPELLHVCARICGYAMRLTACRYSTFYMNRAQTANINSSLLPWSAAQSLLPNLTISQSSHSAQPSIVKMVNLRSCTAIALALLINFLPALTIPLSSLSLYKLLNTTLSKIGSPSM